MGCFDYVCECGGETCDHIGGQLHDSNVVIEVPLSDGTIVYLEGYYEQYGYVAVEGYHFYLEQFREFFEGWLENENPERLSKIFLAKRIWTLNEQQPGYSYVEYRDCFEHDIGRTVSDFDQKNLSKYIRADKGIDLTAKRKEKIDQLKAQIKALKTRLEYLEKF
jgi:hypothetical protein